MPLLAPPWSLGALPRRRSEEGKHSLPGTVGAGRGWRGKARWGFRSRVPPPLESHVLAGVMFYRSLLLGGSLPDK
jgi:hypothetical protein